MQTSISDFCHISISPEGVPCTALVDAGSTVTVAWPEVVPAGFELEDMASQQSDWCQMDLKSAMLSFRGSQVATMKAPDVQCIVEHAVPELLGGSPGVEAGQLFRNF
ncbi:hypothetical protein SRHO_G00189600 [Serrasalmus rhombeus]